MFTLADEYEARDKMLSFFYPRSLLYFVSGLLEGDGPKPLVGMQRFYSAGNLESRDAMGLVRAFVWEEGGDRAVWAISRGRGPGLDCVAISHGGFAFDATLQDSLVYMLNR
jgi:hypothetical protein